MNNTEDNEHVEHNKYTIDNTAPGIDMPERRELFKKAAMTAMGLAVGGTTGLAIGGALSTTAEAQTAIECTLTASELQFADTVDRIFNDSAFLLQMQTAPDQALTSAGYVLTEEQLVALQSANYNLAPTADDYMAVPLVRPLVRVITRGTKPVVRVVTKGTQPVVQVVVNTVVAVSPPDPDPITATTTTKTTTAGTTL